MSTENQNMKESEVEIANTLIQLAQRYGWKVKQKDEYNIILSKVLLWDENKYKVVLDCWDAKDIIEVNQISITAPHIKVRMDYYYNIYVKTRNTKIIIKQRPLKPNEEHVYPIYMEFHTEKSMHELLSDDSKMLKYLEDKVIGWICMFTDQILYEF